MQKSNPTSRIRGLLTGVPTRVLARVLARFACLALLTLGVAGLARTGLARTESTRPEERRSAAHPQDGPHIDLRVEVTDAAVLLKIQLNLACADEFVGAAREDIDQLHAVEHAGLQADLEAFFAREVDVFIDGIRVTGTTVRFEVFEADPSLVGLFPQFGARALTTLRLDRMHSAKQPPAELRLVWRAFPPDLATLMPGQEAQALEVLARVAAGGVEKVVPLAPDAPELLWSAAGARLAESVRFLSVPSTPKREAVEVSLASLALLGLALVLALATAFSPGGRHRVGKLCGVLALLAASWATQGFARLTLIAGGTQLPSASEALAIFEPLHANIYRAFDYTDPSDVYDALAQSVEGNLLQTLYEEVYASLIQEEAEGAVGRVQAVELLSTELGVIERDAEGLASFALAAHWTVEGVVFHWNHSHWRVQEARANYTVRLGPDGWRIAQSEMLEQFIKSTVPGGPTGREPGASEGSFELPEEL